MPLSSLLVFPIANSSLETNTADRDDIARGRDDRISNSYVVEIGAVPAAHILQPPLRVAPGY